MVIKNPVLSPFLRRVRQKMVVSFSHDQLIWGGVDREEAERKVGSRQEKISSKVHEVGVSIKSENSDHPFPVSEKYLTMKHII